MPETLGLILGLLLWAAFGAEAGVATIPFILGVFARVRHGNTE